MTPRRAVLLMARILLVEYTLIAAVFVVSHWDDLMLLRHALP